MPRVNDRRVLNGIFWVLRSGAPWRDLPEGYGPRTTLLAASSSHHDPERALAAWIATHYLVQNVRSPRDLALQCLDAFIALGERGGDVGSLEALWDVLRTIGIPGRNGE